MNSITDTNVSNINKLQSAAHIENLLESPPFEIEPAGRTMGAEIRGIDLAQEVDQAAVLALEAALIRYKVIFIRGQNITSERHVEIGKWFGKLEVHPFRPQGKLPELVKLDNHKDNPVLSTDVWHSDTTFRRCPNKYSILRCLRIPATGGDTLWADMAAAYEGLSPRFRDLINGLSAVHDFKNFRVLYKDQKDELRRMEDLYPNPVHPVVRTHPISGQKIVYVNAQFTVNILGLGGGEDKVILDMLLTLPKVPEYQFRLKWQPGTVAFWDNTATQHYAANDYYPERRTMERVAVIGDEPF